MNSKRRY